MQQPALKLKFGQYEDLHSIDGLAQLDQRFLSDLAEQDSGVHDFLMAYRQGVSFERDILSQGLIACAERLDQFLVNLFDISDESNNLRNSILSDNPIIWFKKNIVLKAAKRRLREEIEATFDGLSQALQAYLTAADPELSLAIAAMQCQDETLIESIVQWSILAMRTEEGAAHVREWVSFTLPQKLDFEHLIALETVKHHEHVCLQSPKHNWHQRDGFDLTDKRMSLRQVMDEVNYCVFCHKNDGDYCRSGFPLKKKQRDLGFKHNPLDEVLAGCPLDEKISEMNALKRDAYSLGALAMVMVDNPMCPATGHRICNDCMKACIYQKQEPVDIPQIETRVLSDVLGLPWGVEIYDLLTRWNPLRQFEPTPKAYNGKKVLVMGMGPAGFTLSHYLTQSGYAVVGMDGLKIEPVDPAWLTQPIHNFNDIYEPLSERNVHGFGGVAEYGITVRWDKNFLKLIYISLMRRQLFQVQGGVRFGGSITVEGAWALGFDHLAVAVGAGLPRELPIENSLAPGMRQANDFLMALQLTGAAKLNSLANLQIRLPAVVIGGGLTGVDTATELQAYYLAQIDKTHQRYQLVCQQMGETSVREAFSSHDLAILDEQLAHAKIYQGARAQAEADGETLDTISLIRRFGGVTIVYRRNIQQSPAYRKNHEELAKAMEEGLFYAENMSPKRVLLDEYGDCSALLCDDCNGHEIALPARSILVATGAKPNVAYAFEHKDTFVRDRYEYQAYRDIEGQLQAVDHVEHTKSEDIGLFTSYQQQDKRVTFLGDTHPSFHGSVVKAISSGRQCFESINALLSENANAADASLDELDAFMRHTQVQFEARIVSRTQLQSDIVEMVIESPLAASQRLDGQIYRLQAFDGAVLMEGVACLAIAVDGAPNQLKLVVIERGASSELVSQLQPGDALCLMGPTGAYSKLPAQSATILLIGQSLAMAYLCSLARTIKSYGHRVIFIADLDDESQIIYRNTIEELCDRVIWHMRQGNTAKASLSTLFVDWHKVYADIDLASVDQVHIIGGPKLLCAMKAIRATILDDVIAENAVWVGSVYGPMQCMLKGVCAQCLQWQVDKNGKRTKAVFACSWQHQPFDKIDIDNLEQRLVQNKMQETLTNLWSSCCNKLTNQGN